MSHLNNPLFETDLLSDMTERQISDKWSISRSTTNKHRRRIRGPRRMELSEGGGEETAASTDGSRSAVSAIRHRPITLEDARDWIRSSGDNPDNYTLSIKSIAYGVDLFSNKQSAVPKRAKETADPAWPVIQPGPAVTVTPPKCGPALVGQWQTAALLSDTQIGFRALDDGTLEEFHDEKAISVALQIIAGENPDQTVVMGDIIDLASQSRWSQEAGFARTTQPAIDRTTLFGAELRASTSGKIVFIEGNHDKRMQNFVEINALSAFGLRKGGLPESWPVMSLPNLLRLDEVGIIYKDAYPASHWWVNDRLRCEHGTKANSSGSTAAQYMNDTPHISRAHGHHHRLEIQSKTTYDRMGKLRNMAISPGCLCRVDGAVPSVNGAIGANGRSAEVFENWQQGVAIVRFKESGEFFVDLVQIDDGVTVYQGAEVVAA